MFVTDGDGVRLLAKGCFCYLKHVFVVFLVPSRFNQVKH